MHLLYGKPTFSCFCFCLICVMRTDVLTSIIQVSTQSIGLAFGLSIAAGACTCVGAAISGFAQVNNNIFLAAAMAASAGVMM